MLNLFRRSGYSRIMSDDDSDPLLELATPRWRRRSSIICLVVFLVGLVSLVTAILLGYFTVIKNDSVGRILDWALALLGIGHGCCKSTFSFLDPVHFV